MKRIDEVNVKIFKYLNTVFVCVCIKEAILYIYILKFTRKCMVIVLLEFHSSARSSAIYRDNVHCMPKILNKF